MDLERLQTDVARRLAVRQVTFGRGRPFVVDPVPRVIDAREWCELEAGLRQRVRALNAFLRDVHGERRIVEAGVVPAAAVDGAAFHEPVVARLPRPAAPATVAGLDVVRGADGEWLVLEDNLRTPSGLAYALAAREALDDLLPVPAGSCPCPPAGARSAGRSPPTSRAGSSRRLPTPCGRVRAAIAACGSRAGST